MKRSRFRMTFGKKMAAIMITAVVLPMAAVILLTYHKLSVDTANNYIDTSSRMVKSVSHRLDDYMKQLETLSMFAYTEKDINASSWEIYRDIISSMVSVLAGKKEIHSMFLYFPEDQECYIVDLKRSQSYADASDMEETPWYQSVAGPDSNYACLPLAQFSGYDPRYDVDGRTPVISFVRRFVSWTGETSVLCMNVRPDVLKEICGAAQQYEDELVWYLNGAGEVIYTNDTGTDGQNPDREYSDRIGQLTADTGKQEGVVELDGDILCYTVSDDSGNRLVKKISHYILTQYSDSLRNTGLLVLAAAALVMIPLLSLLSRSFTGPLRRLEKYMEEAGKGDFTLRMPVKGNDEISHITATFNQMLGEIGTLVNERYKMKLDYRTAQINSLLAQINPHFLNNTLQSVGSVALEQGLTEVYRSINALCRMLRYSIKGENTVSVREEQQNVRDYLYIQQFRFGDRLTLVMDIPEEVLDVKIPKLTLQPLVENAFIHGLEQKKEKGCIRIFAVREEERILFRIEDNGAGIEEETLGRVRRALLIEEGEDIKMGIGIGNVNQRLHLMYGSSAEITIDSVLGEGTAVTVKIPTDRRGTCTG